MRVRGVNLLSRKGMGADDDIATFTEFLRQYLTQVRQELALRLIERLYADGTGKPSKWWMSFQKRRFMHRAL